MIGDDRKYNDEEQERSEPIIEDLRHSRDLEAEPDEPLRVIEPPAPPVADEVPAALPPVEQAPESTGVGEEDELPEAAAEMDQLRQIFGMGLTTYLRSQLGMLINFTVIYLGQAPNPATGLIGADLPKAKLAIDMLDFITGAIQAEMPAAERSELKNILDQLKYAFVQSAGKTPLAPDPPAEA